MFFVSVREVAGNTGPQPKSQMFLDVSHRSRLRVRLTSLPRAKVGFFCLLGVCLASLRSRYTGLPLSWVPDPIDCV